MEPAARIRLCRILEKMKQQSQFSKRLGISDLSTFEARSKDSFEK